MPALRRRVARVRSILIPSLFLRLGSDRTSAWPPARSILPTIDSRTPWRSSGTEPSSNLGPRSRTNTSIEPSSTSAYTRIGPGLGRMARRIQQRLSVRAQDCFGVFVHLAPSPTTTSSIATRWSSSMRLRGGAERGGDAFLLRAAPSVPVSQSRSSRSCRRASAETSRASPARFCIRVSVWRTESWRCAATSACSWQRIRAAFSVAQVAPESPEKRSEDQADCDYDNDGVVRAASRRPPRMSFEDRGRAVPHRVRTALQTRRGRGR